MYVGAEGKDSEDVSLQCIYKLHLNLSYIISHPAAAISFLLLPIYDQKPVVELICRSILL